MNKRVDEIKNFISANQAEMENRYNIRMGYKDIKKPKTQDYEQEIVEEEAFQEDVILDNRYEGSDYFYTEKDAGKIKIPNVIDKMPRQDKQIIELPKPKAMPEIEGNIVVEDKERGVVLTSFYNKKEKRNFDRLYDVSGKKPILIASGNVDYDNGMFIIHYPNRRICDDRGDYLKYMRSALYKLDKANKPNFVAGNVLNILNDGWFEQSSNKDYSVYLCKDEDNGKYRRVKQFSADVSGHRKVTADGTIIDELDRSDWYHKNEYKYDAKNNTLTLVKGEGYEPSNDDAYDYRDNGWYSKEILISPDVKLYISCLIINGFEDNYKLEFYDTNKNANYARYGHSTCIANIHTDNIRGIDKDFWYTNKDGVLTIKDYDQGLVKVINNSRNEKGNLSISEHPMDINEKREGFKYLYWDFEDTKYGTFFKNNADSYEGGTFVKNDGTLDTTLLVNKSNDDFCVSVLPNGLTSVVTGHYSSYGTRIEKSRVYDFKNSCYRDDLEKVYNLGDKFYAAQKTGEKLLGIYEIADEETKNPLIMVDSCCLARNDIIFTKGDTKCRCEVTPEGKLKPVAKQTSEKDLFLSTGGQWVKVDLKEDTRADISSDYIEIKRSEYGSRNGDEYPIRVYDIIYLSNNDAEEFAHSIAQTGQKEKIAEKPLETYHNAKDRLKQRLEEKNNAKPNNPKGHTLVPSRSNNRDSR